MTSLASRLRLLAIALALAAGAGSAAAAPDPTCPACQRWVAAEWRFCPFDGTSLRPERSATPAPAPAAPPTAAPAVATVTAVPPLGSSPAGATATATAPPADTYKGPIRKVPTETIDDLFTAIAAGDTAALRRCYRWDVFFAATPPEERDARITSYIGKLISKVRPSLEGRDRVPGSIKLSASDAEIQVSLRDHVTRHIVATYDVRLSREDDGWKIVGIRP